MSPFRSYDHTIFSYDRMIHNSKCDRHSVIRYHAPSRGSRAHNLVACISSFLSYYYDYFTIQKDQYTIQLKHAVQYHVSS
jgi:hypothetical protein